MDESWRMRMGTPNLAGRRRASEDLTAFGRSAGLQGGSSSGVRDAEDFNDVFGGPPKSVLNGKLSCDFAGYDYFYREIFRRREEEEKERCNRSGMRLPEFRIPARRATDENSEFYSDVFGSPIDSKSAGVDDDRREKKSRSSSWKLWRSMSMSKWTSKSKSNLSSAMSYDEINPPIRSGIGEEDVALASYAAKLRPINVPCRWNSASSMAEFHKNQSSANAFPPQNLPTAYAIDDYEHSDEHFTRSSNPSFYHQFPSSETDIPYSTTVGIPVDDVGELESPSSANSMLYHYPEASKANLRFNASFEEEDDDDDDEFVSSYVIEVNRREGGVANEAADIDEAIAWAKEKYHGCSSSSGELNVRQQHQGL